MLANAGWGSLFFIYARGLIREEHAKAFNYDLQAICDDLRQKQAVSNRQIISQPLKQPSRRNNK
ncbi:hypothetical protein [Nostoc sp. ChiSLP03a]|uniref:hypothetical protein n=1 Tax=Nostoc sp. ChiSLP03a TaxID=3075380 RepID=UPI002AD44476|nr:hypothetical protein [Nostoc sp. ChiSLP03a]MDZ8209719.1 hypothetical protein [Nostoc sp. ChiSLP03a]